MFFGIRKDFRNKKKAYILKIRLNSFGSERRKTKSLNPGGFRLTKNHNVYNLTYFSKL